MLGVVFLEKEIEVEVGSPEVKGLWELKNKRRQLRLLFCLAIGPYWEGYQDSEHNDIYKLYHEENRVLEEILNLEEAISGSEGQQIYYSNNEPERAQSEQFWLYFVFDSGSLGTETNHQVNVSYDLKNKNNPCSYISPYKVRNRIAFTERFAIMRNQDNYQGKSEVVDRNYGNQKEYKHYALTLLQLSEFFIGVAVEGLDDLTHSTDKEETQESGPEDYDIQNCEHENRKNALAVRYL